MQKIKYPVVNKQTQENKMKHIKLLAVLSILATIYFYMSDSDYTSENDKKIKARSAQISQSKVLSKKDKKNNKQSKVIKSRKKDFSDSELFAMLQTPSNRELEDSWLDEYGCYNKAECKYYYLNASTYEEALWMKNNGYPTESMMKLVNDPRYKEQLDAMARKKYPAALAIASISAMERGDFVEASNLALSNVAYSDRAQTYPHLLYGEALLANNMKPLAVPQFYIAGLLGDNLSQGRAAALSPNVYFATTALNTAHRYLGRIFGGEVPKNPRPKITDNDG